MKLNHAPTGKILNLTATVSEQLGELIALQPENVHPESRKQARIDSIHATMQLEGKLLSREKTAEAVGGFYVDGPRTRLLEVSNLINVYNGLYKTNPRNQDSLLSTQKKMAIGLEDDAGQYRTTELWIFRGRNIIGMAPSPGEIAGFMNELFDLLSKKDEHIFIKACTAHFILESIQPFSGFNGMMGRLWQTLLLMKVYPMFEFLPYEKQILQNPKAYHRALAGSEAAGHPAEFIEYMLQVITGALKEYDGWRKKSLSPSDRILYFHKLGMPSFTRRDYMKVNRNISTATASRDLEKGVDAGLFRKSGIGNATIYTWQKP
ncbi:MAG: Fic family protein [Bacteroidota bacterium]